MHQYRVLDLINTDKSAKELLHQRVQQVNRTGRYDNAIYCGSGEYVDKLRNWGHKVHVIDQPRDMSLWAILKSSWHTYKLFRRERFDVVHTHGSVIGVIGRLAAIMARVPVVVHQVHGFHHHAGMSRLKKWIFIQPEKLLGLFTDRLLFQNQADIDECLRQRIAPARKLVWIGNGIQFTGLHSGDEPANDPPVILCVSRFEPVKNHTMLLEAAKILRDRGIRFVVQLVGDGDLRPQYEEWVRANGLESHVQFLGYRDDVFSLTAKANVCTLVSVKEGLPRAIIEAGASGRPMVATDVVGNRDIIKDGVTGYLVPLNDSASLADKFQQLLADPELRHRMGQQAAEYAAKNFNEVDVTNRIIAVYDELLAATARGNP